MEAHEIIARGERIKTLMEDSAVRDTFAEIEEDHYEAIRTSDLTDTQGREIAYIGLRELDVLKARLWALVDAAEIERDNLEKQARRVRAS